MKKLHRTTALLLILLTGLFQVQVTQAAMITTESAIQSQQTQIERTQILDLFAQENLRDQLLQMGVDPDSAADRVANMTDAEIAQLNSHLNDMPAGEGVAGILLTIFIVFIITDMLGATDIFSFVHPIR
ncbi:MAG: DUF6627 family protein [Pseudomonadales bacterium]|jgi:hypothetical protein